ncbi:EexN family lipoprotein [Leisingera daeponensis]|uniref:EexN family lipoprotein n=1 Tax=Leisingera daeponensis TaxID=405746 RepID=A0ABS7NLA3_9RHOB|nr:EexN family lipoprotein [Leisingera daeponensis]MBY6141963.1 EexN family lipoprotein [Leisingera daeponensis]
MKTQHFLITIAFFSAISACKEENRSVEYFVQNEAERAAVLKKCELSDGANLDANCTNAWRAQEKVQIDRERQAAKRLFGGTPSE